MLFVNGLPLAVIELKNAADENATIWARSSSCRPTRRRFRRCSPTTRCWSISDGVQARIGSLGAGREWFKPWRTITGRGRLPTNYLPELQVVLEGVFDKRRFLDLLRYFIVFEDVGGGAAQRRRWPATTSSTP